MEFMVLIYVHKVDTRAEAFKFVFYMGLCAYCIAHSQTTWGSLPSGLPFSFTP